MMKFYQNEELINEYKDAFNVVDGSTPLIKEIIFRGDYSSYSLSSKNPLSDSSIIRVKIKQCGILNVVLKNRNVDYFDLLKKIKQLLELKVIDANTSKEKLTKLVDIINEYQPLFYIYVSYGEFALKDKELSGINTNQLFFVELTEEEISKLEKKPESTRKVEENSYASQLKKDWEQIKRYKYHFIFIIVSSFLFGFATSIGFCNALIGKGIAALFFVCATVGLFLNTSISTDYFATHKFKERLFIYTLLFNLIGILISILGLVIFYISDKGEASSIVPMGTLLGFNVGISIAGLVFSIAVANLYLFLKPKILASKPIQKLKSKKDKTEKDEPKE